MSNDNDTPVTSRLQSARLELIGKVWGDTPKLYNHAVLCSVGLPYRNPGIKQRHFERSSGTTTLRLEAGAVPTAAGTFREVGLPYGPRARLLLLHLCSQSVKTQSPYIEVDDSFTQFAKSLGLSVNGRNLKTLRDQVLRMSAVSMRLSKKSGSGFEVFQGHVFSKLRAELPTNPDQLCLWTSFVEFSPTFYESLRTNAVPLRREAIGALKHSSRGLDVYTWLAHRLWRVRHPVSIRWTTLRHQFGQRSQNINSFKRAFKTALKQVLVVYPEAHVTVIKGGVCLYESPPPVWRRRGKTNGLLAGGK